jgi:pilus assembly protein Flp/PilA
MHSLIAVAKEFARDEDGITAIEYGLIAATMVAAVVAAFAYLTPALGEAFQAIGDKIKSPCSHGLSGSSRAGKPFPGEISC